MTYALDGADRVNSIQNVTENSTYASINYTPSGSISTTMTMGNGVVQQFSFNDRVQPTSIQASTPAGSPLNLSLFPCINQATSCSSGNDGTVQSQTIAGGGLSLTQGYQYDKLNRLTGVQESGGGSDWSEGYQYDTYGNRWVTSSLYNLTLETPQSSSWYSSTAFNRICGDEPELEL